MSYSFLCLSAVFTFSALLCQAQKPSTTPAGGGQSAPSTPGATPSIPGGQPGSTNPRNPGSSYPGQDTRQNPYGIDQQQQIVFLSGKVVMEDGTAPPQLVLIERVCTGSPRPEGYTDAKGRFNFQLGQNNSTLADASTSGPATAFGTPGMSSRGRSDSMGGGQARLIGCELRASLPGFRSESVDLSQRRYMDNPDVGTIILKRLAKVEGFTFSATTAMAPKDARKAYEKGLELVKKQKPDQAETEFQKAVASYPKYAVAWNELGIIYQKQSKLDDARHAYEESVKADSKFVTPYTQLMRIAASQNKWDEAAGFAEKAIKLNPYLSSDVYFLSGVAHYQTKDIGPAEEHTREALKLDTKNQNPKINHLLGVILAQKRDLPGAAEAMRNYLKLAPNASDAQNVKQQLAEIEKTMVLPSETKAAQ